MRIGRLAVAHQKHALVMDFCADDLSRNFQTDAGFAKKPVLAKPRIDPTRGQTAQQAEKTTRRRKIRYIDSVFETRLRGLCRELTAP